MAMRKLKQIKLSENHSSDIKWIDIILDFDDDYHFKSRIYYDGDLIEIRQAEIAFLKLAKAISRISDE